jgi:hypothetical protein
MRELEGLSYNQIGERMGMSRPVVESTLFRARRRLSEEYDELVSGRRCEQVQAVIAAEGERPLRKLGIRDRRQLARHLAHCQPCRRHARMAGVDDSFFTTPGLAAKIAALLPFPWLRWRRPRGGGDEAAAASSSHAVAALQSLPVVARLADSSSPAFGIGRAGAAAAALLVAGAGGGLVAGLGAHGATSPHRVPLRSAPVSHVAATPPARTIHVTGASAAIGATPARAQNISRSHGGGGASGGGGGTASQASTGSSSPAPSSGQGAGASRSPLSGTLRPVGSTLQSATSAGGATSNPLGQVVGSASNTVNGATQGASNTVNKVTQGASNGVNEVTQGASNTVNKVAQGASNTVGKITSGAANTVNKVDSGATNTLNTLTHP